MTRPRRSLLFMPGSNARALEKARTLAADGLILDLEDAVAPDAKSLARDQVARAVAAKEFGKREMLIRINSLDSPWWLDDLNMAATVRPDGVLVPKVSTVEDLHLIAERLKEANADPAIKVWAMIETARAILDVDKLAAQASDPAMRLAGFVFGPNDIARETRIRMVPGRATMLPIITQCVLAAHAHGLEMLDGPYGDIGNMEGLRAECAQSLDLGFDGKTLIHPGQVEGANEAFAPSEQAVADAEGLIQAWEDGRGSGVVTYNGRMVENLHVESARRVLDIHRAIQALS